MSLEDRLAPGNLLGEALILAMPAQVMSLFSLAFEGVDSSAPTLVDAVPNDTLPGIDPGVTLTSWIGPVGETFTSVATATQESAPIAFDPSLNDELFASSTPFLAHFSPPADTPSPSAGASGGPSASPMESSFSTSSSPPPAPSAPPPVVPPPGMNPPSAPPTANNDAYTVSNGTISVPASGVLANDTNPGGQPMTASLIGPASHGMAMLSQNGSFTYTAMPGYSGTDSFTYSVTAGGLTSNTATVTLTVTAPPPPVVNVATFANASEAGSIPGSFNVTRTGNFTQGITVYYSVGGTATSGSDFVALSGSVLIPAGSSSASVMVTPYDDNLVEWSESVTLTVTAGSGYQVGSSPVATVTIADNDTPSFSWTHVAPQSPILTSPGTRTSAEGSSVTLQVSGSDPASQSLSYGATNLPLGLSINTAGLITGTIDFRAAEFNGGHYTPTLILVDALGAYTSTTFDWYATNTNHAPVLDAIPNQSTLEGGSPWLTLTGSDADGELLSFGATGLPSGLTVDPSTGWVQGTVDANTMGTYTVTASANDGIATTTGTFQWVVTTAPPDSTPVPPQRNAEGDAVSLQVSATDPHGATLTYSALNLPPGLGINSTTGLISGTISAGAAQDTPYNTEVDISNGGNSSSRIIPWTVRHVLVTNPGDRTTLGGSAVSLQVQARDSLNASLQYSATGLPAGLSIAAATGLISGTVSAGAIQGIPYAVTVSATNGTQSDSQTFAWTIGHSSDVAPTLSNPGNQINHVDEMVSVQLLATDPEHDVLTYSATGLPSGIGIDPQTGILSGQLYDSSYSSTPFAVTVTADDGHGGTASQSFQWSFRLPMLTGTTAAVNAVEGAAFSNAVVATFTDLQTGAPADYWPYSATINWGDGTTTDDGVIAGANNNFQVTGNHTYAQTGTFTIQAVITQGSLQTITVNSTATVSNPALTATALSPSFTLNDNWSDPIAVFDDPNPFELASGYSATVTWADNATSVATVYGAGGKLAVYASRTFPAAGSMAFNVTIRDNEGATVSASGTATVGQVAAGDVATLNVSLYGTLAGTTPSAYSATINWGDGSAIGIGVINASGNTFSVGGQHRYTVPGSYAVTVAATSPQGGTLTATQTVIVARKPIQVYGQIVDTTVGEMLTNTQVGIIVDPNNALPPAPILDWGDGTSSQGTVVGGGGLYRMLGNKTYGESATFQVETVGSPRWAGFWRSAVGGMINMPFPARMTWVHNGVVAAAQPKVVAPLTGTEKVTKGDLIWNLTAPDPRGSGADITITFKPSKDNPAERIAFLQVVTERTLGGEPISENFGKKQDEFNKKLNLDPEKGDHLDIAFGANQPYYNAIWSGNDWGRHHRTSAVGDGPLQKKAVMVDEPGLTRLSRNGKDIIHTFETAVFAIDSQEVLGVIKWGYRIPSDKTTNVELLYAKTTDVSLKASDQFKKLIQKANTLPEIKYAQLNGEAKVTKPNAKKFGGTSALPD